MMADHIEDAKRIIEKCGPFSLVYGVDIVAIARALLEAEAANEALAKALREALPELEGLCDKLDNQSFVVERVRPKVDAARAALGLPPMSS